MWQACRLPQVHIADKHLIPSLLEEHGLTPQQLRFPPSALETVACSYTREAGVRSLSRHALSISAFFTMPVCACSEPVDVIVERHSHAWYVHAPDPGSL